MKLPYRPGWPSPLGTPVGGSMISFKWPRRSLRKNSWRRNCKYLNQIKEFSENFSGFIGFLKIVKYSINCSKEFRNSCQMCSIFQNSYLKNIFLGEEKCWYVWKLGSFSKTLHCLKNETSLPLLGARDRIKVAWASHTRKKSWRRHFKGGARISKSKHSNSRTLIKWRLSQHFHLRVKLTGITISKY